MYIFSYGIFYKNIGYSYSVVWDQYNSGQPGFWINTILNFNIINNKIDWYYDNFPLNTIGSVWQGSYAAPTFSANNSQSEGPYQNITGSRIFQLNYITINYHYVAIGNV